MNGLLKTLYGGSILALMVSMSSVAHAQVQTYQGTSGQDVFPGTLTGEADYFGQEEYDQIDYEGAPSDYTFSTQYTGQVHVIKANGKNDVLDSIEGVWFLGEEQWYPVADLANNETSNAVIYQGTTGNDVWSGLMTGEANFYGDDGFDQINYVGASTDYNFNLQANGETHVIKNGQNGRYDLLNGVEGIWFLGEEAYYSVGDLTDQTPPPPPPPAEVQVTSLQVVSNDGDRYVLRLTVNNATTEAFTKLSVSAYPSNSNFRVLEKDVPIGQMSAGEQKASVETLLVEATPGNTPSLSDFLFAFDEQNDLNGADENRDGIRDDIEIMIDDYLTNVADAKTHLRNVARDSQILFQSTSANAVITALGNVQKHVVCAEGALEANRKGAIDVLLLQLVDTEERFVQKATALNLAGATNFEQPLSSTEDLNAFCAASLNNNQ